MKYNRKLNSVEQAMELLNRHQGSWNVITISHIQGNLEPDLLRQSLDLVWLRHPRLRCRIIERGSSVFSSRKNSKTNSNLSSRKN